MESIECCLDKILENLDDNWKKPKRLPLDGEEFLKEIEYPNRPEYFMELIDILKDDGYVKLVQSRDGYNNDFKWYEHSAIITVKGILFLNKGGYQQKIIEDNAYKKRLEAMEKRMGKATLWIAIATVILAIGGLIAAWYYLYEIFGD
ncbi:MAG: hypothetical protein KAJ28_09890 [Flavobacteriaceae bacterium]|nr:hypothetical protein [Flavobacteriaceae bacterium]